MILRPYQESAIQKVRDELRAGKKRIMLYSPTGSGKCLGYDTPVVMADGMVKPVQNIQPGDFLLSPYGRAIRVKSTMVGFGKLFKVTPVKGSPYVVNEDHILSLKMTGNKEGVIAGDGIKYHPREIANITVSDWLASTKTFKHCAKSWRSGALEFHSHKTHLAIPPYILGLWLGDGSLHAPALTNIDEEIIRSWSDYAEYLSCKISVDNNNGTRCPTYHIRNSHRGGTNSNQMTDMLRGLGLFKTRKHIPLVYKTASLKDRLELLAGLVDTDGNLSVGYYDFVFKSMEFAEDIAFVARSVGLFASVVTPCLKEATNGSSGKQTYYRFSVCGDIDIIPCRVPRKIAQKRLQKKSALVSGISIESIGCGHYFGFEIDGEDKLFLLGDFQVTHNTEVCMSIVKSAAEKGSRTGFVANRIGLVKQASNRFYKSHIHHGIIQGDNSRSTWHNTLICSIDTLARRGYPDGMNLLIIDEAHGATSKSYKNLIAAHPDIPIIGLSATPFTKGLGREHEFGKLFETIVVAATIRELIELGHLVDCDIYAPSTPDLTGVKINRFGDYDEKQLGIAVDKPGLVGDIIQNWFKYAEGMQTVVFATNIAHSKHICELFIAAGVTAEHIDCYTSDEQREEILDRFNSGVTRVISNVSVLAEGWDSPITQCMILARPTRSLARWIQMVGRALRPHPGKDKALILDHSGTCYRLGYPTDDLPLELDDGKKKEYDSNSKPQEERLPHECTNCHFMVPAGRSDCPKCGCVPHRQNKVETKEGELHKVERHKKLTHEQKQEIWSSALGLREERNQQRASKGKNPLSEGWASNLYKSMTGVWPRGLNDTPMTPTAAVRDMATHNDIAFARRNK